MDGILHRLARTARPHTPGPLARPGRNRARGTGYLADDVPAPGGVRLQLNALQALCRQAFGVRLAAIAVGAPFAMTNAADGLARYAVLAAAVLGVMGSYAMLRDWERFGPRLLAHPSLMALDLSFGAILLLTASPASPSPTPRSARRSSPASSTAGVARASSPASSSSCSSRCSGPGNTGPEPAPTPCSSRGSASAPASSASPCAT